MAITLPLCRLTAEWMEQRERERGGGGGGYFSCLPSSLCVGQSDIPFSKAARNLGCFFFFFFFFLTAWLHWRSRWTNSVNLLTWRSGGSVHPDCISLLKPPKLVFSLVLSRLVYYNALLAGCPRVFLKKLKEWSTAQLASSGKLLNLPTSLLYSTISTCDQSAHGLNTKYLSSASTFSVVHLLHTSLSCFISPLFLILFLASDTRIFRVPRMGKRTPGERSF